MAYTSVQPYKQNPIFIRIQLSSLLTQNKCLFARTLADFDVYVSRTKQELEAMSIIGTEINEDLDKIDRQIQGIHVQVDEALNAAQVLQTTASFYDDKIKDLKDDVSNFILFTQSSFYNIFHDLLNTFLKSTQYQPSLRQWKK